MVVLGSALAAVLRGAYHAGDAYGYIAGAMPGVVTVDGVPRARRIYCVHERTAMMVATTFASATGEYRLEGLPVAATFRVIAGDWSGQYNDVIWSRVRPVPYDIQSLTGNFGVNAAAKALTGGLALVGGEAHVVAVTAGTAPPGITFAVVIGEPPDFDAAGFWVVADGTTVPGSYSWDLTVTAANGTAKTLACTATVP